MNAPIPQPNRSEREIAEDNEALDAARQAAEREEQWNDITDAEIFGPRVALPPENYHE